MYAWDSEQTLVSQTSVPPDGLTDATGMFADLIQIPEFLVRLGDRVHKHFSEGGALQVDAAAQRFAARVDTLQNAIVAESARWGDYRRDVDPEGSPQELYQRDDHWTPEVNRILNTYLPARSDYEINQFESLGWLPTLAAPQALIDDVVRSSGQAIAGSELTLALLPSANSGAVYYTLDGTDPHDQGGAILSSAIQYNTNPSQVTLVSEGSTWRYDDIGTDLGTNWRQTSFSDDAWASGPAELGYGEAGNSTTVCFGNDSEDKYPTTYFLHQFTKPSNDFTSLTLRLKRDDGAVVYLNGNEVARDNMPDGTITYDTVANQSASDDGNGFIDFTIDAGELVNGLNTLAVEIHQSLDSRTGTITSSDISFDAELIGDASLSNAITLTNSVQLRTRTFDGGQWSALHAADFTVAGELASADNLRISEIYYDPSDPTPAEFAVLPGAASDDFEFLEVVNIHPNASIDLTGVELTEGVTYAFPSVELLPGQRFVVVEDFAAYNLRFGGNLTSDHAWNGGLSGSGEKIVIAADDASKIMSVTYDTSDPWAIAANGHGAILELIDPAGTPADEAEKPDRWAASNPIDGTPGGPRIAPLGIVVNEILAHTDPPDVDTIELLNPTGAEIDLGGWWLSDSIDEPLKFRIPDNTVIAAGSYFTLDESDFAGGANGFGLSATSGEEIVLTRSDDGLTVSRFEEVIEFGATFNGQSLGRTPANASGHGGGRLAPLVQPSLGEVNGAFAFSNIIISELNYDPQTPAPTSPSVLAFAALKPSDLEFIELYNPQSTPQPLANWRLRGDADLLAAFRLYYGIDQSVALAGGWDGMLGNSYGLVKLQQPDDPPLGSTEHPNVLTDEVFYDDRSPWATTADGGGDSLNRIASSTLGSFAASWSGESPTGDVTLSFTGGPSVIVGNPGVAGVKPTLADGTYALSYRPSAGSDGFAPVKVDDLYRKFGEVMGDGMVGLSDFAAFRSAFGSQYDDSNPTNGYDSSLDANRDGVIGLTDFAAFRSGFGS